MAEFDIWDDSSRIMDSTALRTKPVVVNGWASGADICDVLFKRYCGVIELALQGGMAKLNRKELLCSAQHSCPARPAVEQGAADLFTFGMPNAMTAFDP